MHARVVIDFIQQGNVSIQDMYKSSRIATFNYDVP